MSAADEFSRERALDRSAPVQIVYNDQTTTVPYRRAVGLVSLGRATWYEEPKKAPRKAKKSTSERLGDSGRASAPLRLPEASGEPTVSAPALSSAEGDKTEYEPSLFDT